MSVSGWDGVKDDTTRGEGGKEMTGQGGEIILPTDVEFIKNNHVAQAREQGCGLGLDSLMNRGKW